MIKSTAAQTAGARGKAARTRQLLVTCTLQAIAEGGEFTGEQVADIAGVSTATFYAHFATKDHALHACLERAFQAYEEGMSEVETIELLLDRGLRQTLTAVVRTVAAVNDEYRSVLRLSRGRIQASKLLRDLSRMQQRRAFEATKRFISLGQASQRIRKGDPELLTATVRTIIDGLDAWTIRAYPAAGETEIPDVLYRYLRAESHHEESP